MNIAFNIDVTEDDLQKPLIEILEAYIARYKTTDAVVEILPKAETTPKFITTEHFDQVWQSWPRRTNKKLAKDRFFIKIKTPSQFLRFCEAINAYQAECRKNKTEEQFMLHLSTFLNRWEGYLPEENVKTGLLL